LATSVLARRISIAGKRRSEGAARWVTMLGAAALLAVLGFMLVVLIQASMPVWRTHGVGWIVGRAWAPAQGQFGALPFIFGTIVTSAIGLLLAAPIGLGTALFVSELAPARIRRPVANVLDLLAAVPSVIYGLWGIFVLAPLLRTWVQPFLGTTLGFLPLFKGPPYGVGMLAAGIILAIMVVPFITAVSREVLLAVPNTQREAALALGATRWETTRIAVLRYGRSGLVGAILLGLGRALGETMAVTMVIGNRPEVALSLFAPGYTMASVIANEFTEATSDLYLSALIEIGLLLFVVTVIVNGLARLLVWSVGGPVKVVRE